MATVVSQFVKDQLRIKIQSATSINDLIGVLQHLSLPAIKGFVNQQIEQETLQNANKMYYESFSIQEILPDDVQQCILSSDGLYHPKTICKKWKLLSDKNETIKMRKIYRSTMVPPPSNQVGSTYVVHPKRTHLNAIEISLGYKGPFSLSKALNNEHLKDGDRLLIHDGNYTNDNGESFVVNKSLQIIGVSKNVWFEDEWNSYNIFRLEGQNGTRKSVNFENISFCGTQDPDTYYHFRSGVPFFYVDKSIFLDLFIWIYGKMQYLS